MRIIESTNAYTIEVCVKHDISRDQSDRSIIWPWNALCILIAVGDEGYDIYLTAALSGASVTSVRADPLKRSA